MSGDRWDELRRQAQEHASEGGGLPDGWGESVDIEVGDEFVGRFRGHGEGGKSGAWLVWDEDDAERFIWGCYRLDQEFDRLAPARGDRVVIYRSMNYKTRFDEPGEATGLSYGVASEPCEDALPDETGDLPF